MNKIDIAKILDFKKILFIKFHRNWLSDIGTHKEQIN